MIFQAGNGWFSSHPTFTNDLSQVIRYHAACFQDGHPVDVASWDEAEEMVVEVPIGSHVRNIYLFRLRQTNIAMGNPPFEDVSPT